MDGQAATPRDQGMEAGTHETASQGADVPGSTSEIKLLTADTVESDIAGLPIVAKTVLRQLVSCDAGSLQVTVPTGQTFLLQGKEDGPDAQLTLHNWGILTRTFRANSIGTGESYIRREWESDDPAKVLEFALTNWTVSPLYEQSLGVRLLGQLRHWLNRNTKAGSKRNISAHYDLGNAFYELWLDETMTYSSALFEKREQSLEDAQNAKYCKLAQSLALTSDSEVLEVGCGWGGFAELAAKEFGSKLKCLTISREQYDYARERIHKAGLAERVDIVFQDYRDETGSYDAIASIEMIEAVGESFWPSYFGKIAASLKPQGRAGIQAICINDVDFPDYREGPDFIQRYVFPGGMLLSPDTMVKQGEMAGLHIEDQLIFAQDYAETLRIWRERFLQAWPQIKAMGFDERFKRIWEFYLFYCEAGFRHETIDVRQVIYQHA
ncbi:MAG: cyclopropane-fatty-acyl-phospholipid synthase family protein [Pseudomonadota bacterium]